MPLGYDVDRLKRLSGSIDSRLTTAEGEIDTLQNLTQGLDYDAGDPDVSFDLRWDDVLGEILPGLSLSAPTAEPFRDTGFVAYFFRHDQDDDLHFRFQLPHRWKAGTDVKLHIHIAPMVDPSASPQYVIWEARYAWADYGRALPAVSGWTTVEARTTVSTGDAFKATITPLFTATPPGTAKESSILCVRVRRLGSSAPSTPGWTDTYTTSKASPPTPVTAQANVMILSCDLHYQSEKIGTTAEIPT